MCLFAVDAVAAADLSDVARQQELKKSAATPLSITDKGSHWHIVSVRRMPPSSAPVKIGEQLRYEVKLKKTGTSGSLPIRLKVLPAKPKADYKGSYDGIKANIYAKQNEVVTKTVLVAHRDIYKYGVIGYGFDMILTKPDGTPFSDLSPGDNRKKIRLTRERDPVVIKATSSGVERRSKVAGAPGREIQVRSPDKSSVLARIDRQKAGNSGTKCIMQTYYDELLPNGKSGKFDSIDWCALNMKSKVKQHPSHLSKDVTDYATMGIRVCSSSSAVYAVDLVTRKITNKKLDESKNQMERQWHDGESCTMRPWKYCPKDVTGQRMVAIGMEAHVKDSDEGFASELVGIRLICRPLTDILIDD